MRKLARTATPFALLVAELGALPEMVSRAQVFELVMKRFAGERIYVPRLADRMPARSAFAAQLLAGGATRQQAAYRLIARFRIGRTLAYQVVSAAMDARQQYPEGPAPGAPDSTN